MRVPREEYLVIPVRDDAVKSATTFAVKQACRDIMRRIYDEEPSYWPFGLDVDYFNPDRGEELYLVREKSASADVGFVGWQCLPRGTKKVGYYAIGILPEYRNNGLAKEAVSAILDKKAGEVDEVRAMIARGNGPSFGLARSIGVQTETI